MKLNILTAIALSLTTFAVRSHAQQGAPPDPQMKVVLDELASLGGKPIDSLNIPY